MQYLHPYLQLHITYDEDRASFHAKLSNYSHSFWGFHTRTEMTVRSLTGACSARAYTLAANFPQVLN